MTLQASHAFAPTFVHTAAGYDLTITPSDTGTPVAVNVPSGSYRMCLAPQASDFLRELETRLNAGLFISGSAMTAAVSLSYSGIVNIAFSIPTTSITIDGVLARRLGLDTTYGAKSGITANYPVWYLALLSAGTGGWWQPVQSGGVEQTAGGVVYSFAASFTSYTRSLDVQWQPTNPTYQASCGCDATPMFPADQYLNSIGDTTVARQWSVLDVVYASRNALCGVSIGTWRTLKSSTTETLWQAYLAAESLLGTKIEPFRVEWIPWQKWKLSLVAPSTGMRTTRA